jgi:hypothetical protein
VKYGEIEGSKTPSYNRFRPVKALFPTVRMIVAGQQKTRHFCSHVKFGFP